MNDSMDEHYNLTLAFDSDVEEFARGFEAGDIWGRMKETRQVNQLISVANVEMVIRMAESQDWTFSGEPVNDDWFQVRLEKSK